MQGNVAFAGLRRIDDQDLALLERGDTIMVLPVDEPTARLLKRTVIGEAVIVSNNGSIERKGRGR